MQAYSHILTLRVYHPDLDPDLVSLTLGLEARHSWRAGDPRKTPKGTSLEGVRSSGYWASDPFSYGWRDSTDAQIEDALDELLGFLEPNAAFLNALSQGGATMDQLSQQPKLRIRVAAGHAASHCVARCNAGA